MKMLYNTSINAQNWIKIAPMPITILQVVTNPRESMIFQGNSMKKARMMNNIMELH